LFLSPCAAWTAADAAPARRALDPDDFYRIQTLSEPRMSPDGLWIAYVVTGNDQKADESRSAIWMQSWDGGERVKLTNPAHGTHSPRWSPDGRYLSYLAIPPGAEHEQLLLLDRRGGEPRSIFETKDDIGAYDWSPDGAHLVLAIQHGEEDPKSAKPIVIDAMHFKQDEEGYLAAGVRRHLVLLDVASAATTALTSDAAFNEDLPTWSPDGRRIAFVRTHAAGIDDDGGEDIDVIAAEAGGAPTRLARPFAPNSQQIAWSPDGTLVAYLQGLAPKYNAYMQDQLAVVAAPGGSPPGGSPRVLTAKLDRAVASYAFARDSASIIASIEDDGTMRPVKIDLRGGPVSPMAVGEFVVTDLTAGGGHMAGLYSDDRAPSELYAIEAAGLRKLTAHNDAWLADIKFGATRPLRFKSKDGTEVHGFAIEPPDFVAGQRYPTVLWIHGGPNGQDAHSFAFEEYQFRRHLLAAQGFVVLGVNYRGSSGRGGAYAQAILADWGHKEVEDLLAGVDAAVSMGLADAKRLGIGGWSYGGILTDYTIASDPRFKAAVSGAGSANQISMYGMDQYVLQYNAELGPPWRNPELWLRVSYPFFHADRIHTPTLFMGGDKDFNVPIAGGEQMYEALRTLGVPAQLVVYPGEFHGFRRPSFLKDRAARIDAWYRHYLLPETGAAAP
jgi:dipeptidyl aminopeptidase/acylaminoacyl peptidase